MSDVQRCRACATNVDGAEQKKQRRTLNAPFRVALTPIASSVSDSLDVQKFEEGYVCKSCSRELEKMQRLESQLNEVKRNLMNKVTHAARFLPTVETADHQHESVQTTPVRKKRAGEYRCGSSERRKRRRFLQRIESTATIQDSPDVAVSSPLCHAYHLKCVNIILLVEQLGINNVNTPYYYYVLGNIVL